MAEHDVELVDVAVHGGSHGDDLLITTSKCDSGRSDLLVYRDLLTQGDVDGVDDGGVFQITVHHVTVCVEVVAVHVRVLVSVQGRPWVKAVGRFPLVGHFVLVGVFKPGRREVALAEDLGHLVFLEVVHAVLVPVPVAVRGIGWIENVGCVGCHGSIGIAELKTVGHAVSVGVPVGWPVEQAVAVHVHQEPTAVNA